MRLKPIVLLAAAAGLYAGQVNYTYDAAGRFTGVDYGNGATISYAYDNAGNLLSRSVSASTAAMKAPIQPPSRNDRAGSRHQKRRARRPRR